MIKLKSLITEAFKPTDDTTMIKIGVDGRFYPYYLKKIDSTHFSMSYKEKSLTDNSAVVYHIGQHRGEDYYKDIRGWLHNKIKSKEIFNKAYHGNG